MGRQDEQGLKERDGKDTHHNHWNIAEYLAHGAGDKVERHEGNDVGDHCKGDRHGHLARALDRGLKGIVAPLFIAVDVFTDNNGVVDHDAKGDDKGEQRDHIDADTELRDEQKRA